MTASITNYSDFLIVVFVKLGDEPKYKSFYNWNETLCLGKGRGFVEADWQKNFDNKRLHPKAFESCFLTRNIIVLTIICTYEVQWIKSQMYLLVICPLNKTILAMSPFSNLTVINKLLQFQSAF